MANSQIVFSQLVAAVSIGALAVVITEVSGIMQWLKYKLKIQRRLKPFDCEKCLAFWIAIIYFFPNQFYSAGHCQLSIVPGQLVIAWLSLSAVSSIFSIIILKQIRK